MRMVLGAVGFLLVATAAQAQGMFEPGTCALIVASRPTLAEARSYAATLADPAGARVFQGKNGWYAISPVRLKSASADATLRRWKTEGRIPQDSYCSSGAAYVAEIDLKTGKPVGGALAATTAETLVIADRRDGWLNLRVGPGTHFSILRRMDNGLTVRVLERRAGWARIRLASGETGWAALSGMAPAHAAAAQPGATRPATTQAQAGRVWHGWGQQNNGNSWGMEVDLRPASPTVRYPTVPCTAVWNPVSSAGGTTTYFEKVTSGRCIDGHIKLSTLPGDRLGFSFHDRTNGPATSRAVLVPGPYQEGRKSELLALTTAHIGQSNGNALAPAPSGNPGVGAVVALGVLGLIAKGITSGAGGGGGAPRKVAKYPDHFNACRGATESATFCYSIGSPDLKNLCLGRADRNETRCYSISDPDMKNLCLGISRADYATKCYEIGNQDMKNTCLAASSYRHDTFCYNIGGDPWRSMCGGLVLSKNNCFNLN